MTLSKITKSFISTAFFLLTLLAGLFFGIGQLQAQIDYGVNVDEIAGTVSGYAWNDYVGWVDFNAVTYDEPTKELRGNAVIVGAVADGKDGALHMQGDCVPSCGGYGVTIALTGDLLGSAWNEEIGFVEFSPLGFGGVSHDSQLVPSLSGYAWNDSVGWFQMSTTSAPILGDFGVHVNEGLGELERYAWSDTVGWIDFNGVLYNSSNGELSGVADITGLTQQGQDGSLIMRGDCTPTCGGYGVTINSRNQWEGYAWNDLIGWIDFAPEFGGVYHNPAENPSVSGWAWGDVIGWVEMGRAVYPPPGNECEASPFNTCKYAWSDTVGWISHNSIDDPSVPVFGVHAGAETNYISGHAWNDILGYIDFSTASFDGTTGELSGDATILDFGGSGALTLRGDCTPTCGGFGVTAQSDGMVSGFAWNDTIGWVDFQPALGGVFYDENQNPSISGWAWNDSYGWIGFRFTNYDIEYGVNLESDGNFTGYAWNDNVGWIDYDPAGPYPAAPQTSVRWNPITKEVSGWAQAVSIDAAGSDGWIEMRDSSGPVPYGVIVDDEAFGDWSGYSWSNAFGWTSYDHSYGAVHTDFNIVSGPSIPILIEPLDCVDTYTINPLSALSPALDWNDYGSIDGSTQINYQIQIDTDPLFSAPLVDETVPSDSSLYTVGLGVLDYNFTYYWRVRVENSNNEVSEWGEQGALGENNCFNTPLHPAPVCAYTMAPTAPILDQPVQFTDTTTFFGGATGAEWLWDFGDGDMETIIAPTLVGDTIHTYEDQIDVTITLDVTDSDGYACMTETEASVGLQLPEFKSIIPR